MRTSIPRAGDPTWRCLTAEGLDLLIWTGEEVSNLHFTTPPGQILARAAWPCRHAERGGVDIGVVPQHRDTCESV